MQCNYQYAQLGNGVCQRPNNFRLKDSLGSLGLVINVQEGLNLHKRGFWFFFSFIFLGLHTWHMEGPRREVDSDITATATRDLSHVHDLHHSSWQHQILNPWSEARDGSHILMDASRIVSTVPHQELQQKGFINVS